MFDTLIHADWSKSQSKRWMATARRLEPGWYVEGPAPVGASEALLSRAFSLKSVLLGFDFPIGVPVAYGRMTGFQTFPEALAAFGIGDWDQFFHVAKSVDQISTRRPFYPDQSIKGSKRDDLTQALGVEKFSDLIRLCERADASGRAACSLFWTLGGNQVGKAALTGWNEIVRPALEAGARLWPFEGSLDDLSNSSVVIAETYPAIAYGIVGVGFASRESKTVQADRASKAAAIFAWAEERSVSLSAATRITIDDGFGARRNGEDAFDALMGLLKMIEVVDGRRRSRPPESHVCPWEGWILGR